jgi:hypothetical protein
VAHHDDAGCRDVASQVAVDEVLLGPGIAHVPVTVHEPSTRNDHHARAASNTVTRRQINLSRESRPAVASRYLEGLCLHVAQRVSFVP